MTNKRGTWMITRHRLTRATVIVVTWFGLMFGSVLGLTVGTNPTIAADAPGSGKPKAITLKVNQASDLILPVTGKYRVECRSQWHKIDLHCKVNGRMGLRADIVSQLEPGKPVTVGQTWKLPTTFAVHFAERLHVAQTYSPSDPDQWAKWRGSGQKNAVDKHSGSVTATLKDITQTDEGTMAIISVQGNLRTDTTGSLSSRYGPNAWTFNWNHGINGELHLNLATQQVVKFRFGAKSSQTGKYFTPGRGIDEPFKGTMSLNLDQLSPPSAKVAARVSALVAKLGDNDFSTREQATLDLQKLGISIAPLLQKHAAKTEDAEVRVRLERVLRGVGG